MDIIRQTGSLNLIQEFQTDFQTNLGWEESFKDYEKTTLKKIVNPVENYETIRYIHEPYETIPNIVKPDIWYNFYFVDNDGTYDHGQDYELVGITNKENYLMLKQSTKSFFRLEFYDKPEKLNQKLIFAKNLSLPLGEKVYNDNVDRNIFVPIFNGNNYRNTENMYLFWFQDETIYTGNTFYLTARFFNADDGTINNFANKNNVVNFSENNDMYYLIELDKINHTYQIFNYNGVKGDRVGLLDTPIKFYEINDVSFGYVTPTPTPTSTPILVTPTPTSTPILVTPSPTLTLTPTTSSTTIWYRITINVQFEDYLNVGDVSLYIDDNNDGIFDLATTLTYDNRLFRTYSNLFYGGVRFYCEATHIGRQSADQRAQIITKQDTTTLDDIISNSDPLPQTIRSVTTIGLVGNVYTITVNFGNPI